MNFYLLCFLLYLAEKRCVISGLRKLCIFEGWSGKLFSSDELDIRKERWDLYINGINYTHIAAWKFTNSSPQVVINDRPNIFVGRKKNIWIYDVGKEDRGKYIVKYKSKSHSNVTKGPEVELAVFGFDEEKGFQLCQDDPPYIIRNYSGTKKLCVFKGKSEKLFSHDTLDNHKERWDLYCSNANNALIARWKLTNSSIEVLLNDNPDIFVDSNRNIWIVDVDKEDEGKYFVKYKSNFDFPDGPDVDLFVFDSTDKKKLEVCQADHPTITDTNNATANASKTTTVTTGSNPSINLSGKSSSSSTITATTNADTTTTVKIGSTPIITLAEISSNSSLATELRSLLAISVILLAIILIIMLSRQIGCARRMRKFWKERTNSSENGKDQTSQKTQEKERLLRNSDIEKQLTSVKGSENGKDQTSQETQEKERLLRNSDIEKQLTSVKGQPESTSVMQAIDPTSTDEPGQPESKTVMQAIDPIRTDELGQPESTSVMQAIDPTSTDEPMSNDQQSSLRV